MLARLHARVIFALAVADANELDAWSGVLELEKRRPVDVLQQMLEERSNSKLEQFFKSYGAAEVAAMCILLVTSPPSDTSAVRTLMQILSACKSQYVHCSNPDCAISNSY